MVFPTVCKKKKKKHLQYATLPTQVWQSLAALR